MEVLSEHLCQGWLEGYLLTGTARPLLLLRGLHPYRGLDGEPAREVAEDDEGHSLAPAHRLAQLPPHQPRLEAGPQRLQPPGPRLHRPHREQEGGRRPRLSAARRQHPPVGHGALPAQQELHQRDRGRQAAGPPVPGHGRGRSSTAPAASASGIGPHRPGRRAGRGHGLLRATSRPWRPSRPWTS